MRGAHGGGGSPWGRRAAYWRPARLRITSGDGAGGLQVVCVLAPGEGSNAYGHARAMRTPLMTSRDSPDRRRLRELYLHAWVARPWRTDCMSSGRARRVRGGETAARGCADPGPGAGAAAATSVIDRLLYHQRTTHERNLKLIRPAVSKSHLTVDVRYFARTAASTVYAFRRLAGPLPPPPGLPRHVVRRERWKSRLKYAL
jgi:hypothetical protein